MSMRRPSRSFAGAWLAILLVLVSAPPRIAAQGADTTAVDSLRAAARIVTMPATQAQSEEGGWFSRLTRTGLGQLYVKGGIFMHPLLLCAIMGVVLSIERMWTLSRARSNTRRLMMELVRALREEGPEAARATCQRERGPIAAVLHAGLLRAHRGTDAVEKAITTSGAIEMAFLERGLTLIASISNVAPLLGFLGTVSGMISAFAAIAAAEQVSAKLVAKGIEEALITTAAGLIIAVPLSVFYSFFVMSIDRFVIEMEQASAELIDELLDNEDRRGRAN